MWPKTVLHSLWPKQKQRLNAHILEFILYDISIATEIVFCYNFFFPIFPLNSSLYLNLKISCR